MQHIVRSSEQQGNEDPTAQELADRLRNPRIQPNELYQIGFDALVEERRDIHDTVMQLCFDKASHPETRDPLAFGIIYSRLGQLAKDGVYTAGGIDNSSKL